MSTGPDARPGICRLICVGELYRIAAASPLKVRTGVALETARFAPYRLTMAPAYAPFRPGSTFVRTGTGAGKPFTGVVMWKAAVAVAIWKPLNTLTSGLESAAPGATETST